MISISSLPSRLACAACLVLAAPAVAQSTFGSVDIGASANATVTVKLSTAAAVATVSVVTQGAAGLDFSDAGTGTCAPGAYPAGQACTVGVSFQPRFAGTRLGAALLKDASGRIVAITYISGAGTGPQAAFNPAPTIAIDPYVSGIGLSVPFGMNVDGSGNLFIADSNNGRVVELPANGGPPIALDPFADGTGLSDPAGIVVDGAGNVYISDLNTNLVVEIPADGTAPTALNLTVNGIAMNYPCGLAIDGSGNLYIADVDNARVLLVPADGSAVVSLDPQVNGNGLKYPVTLAMDTSGNLYIADEYANQVVEIPAGGGPPIAIAPSVNGQALYWPYGVVVDAAGNLLINDYYNRIIEVPANGDPSTLIASAANGLGLNSPINMAMDGAGDLWIADSANNRILAIQRSQPPSLSFAATSAGTLSSDSPKNVTLTNIGNSTLSLPVPSTGANPSASAGFTLDQTAANACPLVTSASPQPGTLSAGASCQLAIGFQPPAAGAVYGSLAVTTDSGNAPGPAYSAQNVLLSGDAPLASLSSQRMDFGPQQIGVSTSAGPLTLTNAGSASLSIAGVAINGSGASLFSLNNGCNAPLAAGASCAIGVGFTPSAAGLVTATLTVNDGANDSPQTIPLTGRGAYLPAMSVNPSSASINTAQSLAVQITITGASNQPAPTGSVIATIGTYVVPPTPLAAGGANLTVPPGSLAVGIAGISVAYTPDSASANLYLATSGASSVTVTMAQPPAATTGSTSAVSSATATLAATVNPNGVDTHAWFLYGTSTTLAGAAQTPAQDLGTGSSAVALSANLSGLSPSTTYYFQAVAQSSVGTSNGAIASFITTAPPTFALTGPSAGLSLAPGAATGNTATITLTPANGFSGAIALSCSIAPAAPIDPPTCSLPQSATIAGVAAQTVQLTVTTTAASAQNRPPSPWLPAASALAACLAVFIRPRRRRYLLVVLLALVCVAASIGCGSLGGAGDKFPPHGGTPAGAYNITVTGTSGSLTETATLGLTIQ